MVPTVEAVDTTETASHAHVAGLGGGGFFFMVNPMFPALIDHTGPVDVRLYCPNGFREASHYHTGAQQFLAALFSWVLVFNVWHESTIEFQPAALRQCQTASAAAIAPSSGPGAATFPEGARDEEIATGR